MKALVTGGGGFLGFAIVKRLRQQGAQVHTLARNHYTKLEALDVTQHLGDLTNYSDVEHAATDCDVVFHVAAKAGIWGDYNDYYRANVTGTKNVIKACRALGIKKLVYTSSPSVVFDGTSMEGLDESLPYPHHYETAYPETKAIAERAVIAANDNQLATVSLRPHLIWGPADNHLTPRIIERGGAGKLRRIGKQDHKVDCIYVDNAAHAHLLAAKRLAIDSNIAGKCYFISQDDPRNLWDIVNGILATADIAPVTKVIPFSLAYSIGWLLETVYKGLKKEQEPPMTRFLARELSTAHWFDMSAAKKEFGYTPLISIEEGFIQLNNWQKTTERAKK
ncbi:MAG: 3-beta hydroxysteroid dehydrogenase [Desulfobacteraceae bacterium 4572_35.2]|nr:MAG: 3-beta hydroxysteroid dehydrogenase [Desulfobacteraceae bacterium 4572_35.2]